MSLPKTYRGILSLLIKIAEHGNDYGGNFSQDEQLVVGALIAGIQNDLGEMSDLLEKLKLKYHG